MSYCDCGARVASYEERCLVCGAQVHAKAPPPPPPFDPGERFWAGLRAIADEFGAENCFPQLRRPLPDLGPADVDRALARIRRDLESELDSQQGGW